VAEKEKQKVRCWADLTPLAGELTWDVDFYPRDGLLPGT